MAKLYNEVEIAKWNTTHFRQYLTFIHTEKYGLAYVTRSYAMEAGMVKNMIKEYGSETVKRFIDECFNEYKPTEKYPTLNFVFMYSYMRERVLPKVLLEVKRQEQFNNRDNTGVDVAWF